jgi:hypothetical protein
VGALKGRIDVSASIGDRSPRFAYRIRLKGSLNERTPAQGQQGAKGDGGERSFQFGPHPNLSSLGNPTYLANGMARIREYCNVNPLAMVADAVMNLYRTFPRIPLQH